MKILKNTLSLSIDTWEDPGDYPSAMGLGPLPSYKYVDAVEGSLVVELDSKDFDSINSDWEGDWKEYLHEELDVYKYGIKRLVVSKWGMERKEAESGFVVELTVEKFTCEYEDDGPDWDFVANARAEARAEARSERW